MKGRVKCIARSFRIMNAYKKYNNFGFLSTNDLLKGNNTQLYSFILSQIFGCVSENNEDLQKCNRL